MNNFELYIVSCIYLHVLAYIYTYVNDNAVGTIYSELESLYVLCAITAVIVNESVLFVSPPGEYYSNFLCIRIASIEPLQTGMDS